jgi:hypothetical protein
VTRELCAAARGAEVVSVLEGGYALAPAAAHPARKRGGGPAAAERDEARSFAQLAGDGGLVKGVLAHVAGLAGLAAL